MKTIIVFFFIALTISCNSNWGHLGGYKIEYDSEIEYYISLDQGQEIYASDDAILAKKKGVLIKFHKNGRIDSVYAGKGWIIVPSFIDKKNTVFNDDFILVDQKPLDEIFQLTDSNYNINRDYEKLMRSLVHKYWIICKKSNDVFGPLSKEDFLQAREMLNIPEKLKIKLTD